MLHLSLSLSLSPFFHLHAPDRQWRRIGPECDIRPTTQRRRGFSQTHCVSAWQSLPTSPSQITARPSEFALKLGDLGAVAQFHPIFSAEADFRSFWNGHWAPGVCFKAGLVCSVRQGGKREGRSVPPITVCPISIRRADEL